jgi:acetyl-CoA carboxylase biotin carboxyl carrier protein
MSEQPEVEVISRLMEMAAKYGLQELEVDEAGLKVQLRAPEPLTAEEQAAGGAETYLWPGPLWSPPTEESAASGRPATAEPLLAPVSGTFYRAQAPTDPPFVEVGGTVEDGQPVGLIEAMKVFSQVVADRAGVVVEIVAQNGKMVQHGDVLMYIDPIAS